MSLTSLTFASELRAPANVVWETVSSLAGVNAELAPWLRMSSPREAREVSLERAPIGTVLFVSWVQLLGALPIDRHALRFAAMTPGRGFVEDSTSWTERRWEHRRTVDPRAHGGCTVTDRLTFQPRLALTTPVIARIVAATFRHRHRKLRARFGAVPLATPPASSSRPW